MARRAAAAGARAGTGSSPGRSTPALSPIAATDVRRGPVATGKGCWCTGRFCSIVATRAQSCVCWRAKGYGTRQSFCCLSFTSDAFSLPHVFIFPMIHLRPASRCVLRSALCSIRPHGIRRGKDIDPITKNYPCLSPLTRHS